MRKYASLLLALCLLLAACSAGAESEGEPLSLIHISPAHRLFELVEEHKKPEVEVPRSYRDYDAIVHLDKVPAGVEMGFQRDAFGPVVWGALPEGEDWLRNG